MPDDERDEQRDVLGLTRASGLRLTDEEEQQVALLYRRFTRDRVALTASDLREAEPAIVFLPPAETGGEDA